MASTDFSNMVQTPESRSVFVKTAVDFLKKNKFDGLDIDWEYPCKLVIELKYYIKKTQFFLKLL